MWTKFYSKQDFQKKSVLKHSYAKTRVFMKELNKRLHKSISCEYVGLIKLGLD